MISIDQLHTPIKVREWKRGGKGGRERKSICTECMYMYFNKSFSLQTSPSPPLKTFRAHEDQDQVEGGWSWTDPAWTLQPPDLEPGKRHCKPLTELQAGLVTLKSGARKFLPQCEIHLQYHAVQLGGAVSSNNGKPTESPPQHSYLILFLFMFILKNISPARCCS